MKELSNRVIYTAFSGSASIKLETCKLFTLHAGENTGWFQEYQEHILNLLPYLIKEKDLSLLREFMEFLRCLDRLKFDWIAETIDYLKEKAPFAEIRRSALAIYKAHQGKDRS